MKLKLVKLGTLSVDDQQHQQPYTLNQDQGKMMKLIIKRRNQVLYHYKSHPLLNKPFISHIIHDFMHHPYCMLSSTIMHVEV